MKGTSHGGTVCLLRICHISRLCSFPPQRDSMALNLSQVLTDFTGPSGSGKNLCLRLSRVISPRVPCRSAALWGSSLSSHSNKAGLCRAIHYRPVGAQWLRTYCVHSVDIGTRTLGIEDGSEIEASGEGSGVDVQEEGGDVSRLPCASFFRVFS